LGPDDFEVGLSVGHLASLYNYHMKKYPEAISLYVRSINISKYGIFYSFIADLNLIKIICVKLKICSKCYKTVIFLTFVWFEPRPS